MLEVKARRQNWRDGVELLVFVREGATTSVGENVILRVMEDGECISQPTMTLTYSAAQMLIDELWACGLRPSEGTGSAGSMAATERHLKDMQSVAKGLLRKFGVEAQ